MGGYLRVAVTMDISIDFGEIEWLLFFLRCAILCFCVDSFVRQRSKDPRQSQEYSRRSKSIDSYLLFTNAGSLNCKIMCAEIQWLWTWEADTTKCSSNFFYYFSQNRYRFAFKSCYTPQTQSSCLFCACWTLFSVFFLALFVHFSIEVQNVMGHWKSPASVALPAWQIHHVR